MNKNKMNQKEEHIIKFMNDSISNNNLKYENIKNKINLNLEEKEADYSSILKIKQLIKLSFISLLILSVVLTFSMVLIKKQPNLYINSSLTTALINNNNNNIEYSSILDLDHKFYNIYASTSEDSYFYRNSIPVEIKIGESSKNFQFAYLHEDIIDEVNTYFDNMNNLTQYHSYVDKLNYYGINDIYSKYQYYLYMNNIDTTNEIYQLKWLDTTTGNTPYLYKHYQLILAVEINEIKEAINLTNNEVINIKLEYLVEMNVSVNKNKVTIIDRYNDYEELFGTYLFYIDKNYQDYEKLFFSENYIYKGSTKVQTINNQKVICGVLPTWYVKILNNEYVHNFYSTYYPEINNIVSLVNGYYINYTTNYNDDFEITLYQVYYSYDIIEIFLK